MTYEAVVDIDKETYNKVNRLLEIESLEEMTDQELMEAGANTNTHIGVYGVQFEDGSYVRYDLCSGAENYWDDVVFSNDTGDYVIDCSYELDDMELEIEGNTYIVRINIV